jgi:hypothetical protein
MTKRRLDRLRRKANAIKRATSLLPSRDRVIHGRPVIDEAIKATRIALGEGHLRADTPQAILAAEVERLRDLLTPNADAAMARVKVALWHLWNDIRDPMAEGIPDKRLPDPNDALSALEYSYVLISEAVSGEKP